MSTRSRPVGHRAPPARRGLPLGVVVLIVVAGLAFCLPGVPGPLKPFVIGGALLGAFAVDRAPRKTRSRI